MRKTIIAGAALTALIVVGLAGATADTVGSAAHNVKVTSLAHNV